MKKKYILALIIVLIIAIGIFVFKNSTPSPSSWQEEGKRTNENLPISATLKFENGQEIGLRVADDSHERELGLSYFKRLPQNEGMLFLFEKPGVYPFWMKGMNFPLDIIWLKKLENDTYEIVSVARNVSPESYPQSINPYVASDAVLEINPPAGGDLESVYNLDVKKVLGITLKK